MLSLIIILAYRVGLLQRYKKKRKLELSDVSNALAYVASWIRELKKKERFSRNTPSEIILFNLELIIKFNPSRYDV